MSGAAEIVQAEHIEYVFNSPPAYNAIFSCLSPADVIRVGKTCRLFHHAVAHFHDLAYNVNRHLERFVKDPLALRRLQAKTDFLISGSNALQFFDRTFYPESDLEIFAYPASIKEVGMYLIKEGYPFAPTSTQPKVLDDFQLSGGWGSNSDYHGEDTLRFKHPVRNLIIQVIGCRKGPLDRVLHSHSSCVMNFIAYDAAYSLYPRATFDRRISFPFDEGDGESTPLNGWEVFQLWDHLAPAQIVKDLLATWEHRFLDDKHSWMLPLDRTGLYLDAALVGSESPKDGQPFLLNSWCIEHEPARYHRFFYHLIHSPENFERTYLVSETSLLNAINRMASKQNTSSNGVKYLDLYLPAVREAHLNPQPVAQLVEQSRHHSLKKWGKLKVHRTHDVADN